MKVTYLKNNDPYLENYSDDDVVTENVAELSDQTLMDLLIEILEVFNHPNREYFKESAVKSIKHYTNLITPGQAKILDGLEVRGNSFLIPLGGWGNEFIEIGNENIQDYTIEKIVKMPKDPACYIQVEMPKHIQDKIGAYRVKLEKENRAKERRKKERELENARKILEKAGEKV